MWKREERELHAVLWGGFDKVRSVGIVINMVLGIARRKKSGDQRSSVTLKVSGARIFTQTECMIVCPLLSTQVSWVLFFNKHSILFGCFVNWRPFAVAAFPSLTHRDSRRLLGNGFLYFVCYIFVYNRTNLPPNWVSQFLLFGVALQ